MHQLSQELSVGVRKDWRPNAAWVTNFKKIQSGTMLF